MPVPEELAFREEGIKVTIALSKRSVDFFKREAQRHGTQYQRMIRRLLDGYTQLYSQRPLTTPSSRQPRTARRNKQHRGNPGRGRR